MKIMFVIYGFLENEILEDRIRRLGGIFVFGSNFWLIKTHLSAKKVYEKITSDGYENLSILVAEINPTPGDGYWGMTDKAIWKFIKSITNN